MKFDDSDEHTKLTILPSVSGFLNVVVLFYWLSLFESTSFYVTLLLESFYDTGNFLFIMAVSLLSFANAILILDTN